MLYSKPKNVSITYKEIKELAERISRDIHKAADSPAMRTLMHGNGQAIALSTPSEFAKFLKTDVDKWSSVIRATGVPPQ